MSRHSNISWVNGGGTWNCILGCDKVSAGCKNCYAILQCWMKQHHPNPKIREAFAGLVEKRPDGSLNWTGLVRELPDRLAIPLKVQEPTIWFVASMSDPFHEDVSDDFIDQMFGITAMCPQHVFQFLTKRPERMLESSLRLQERFKNETPYLQAVSVSKGSVETQTEVWWATGSTEEYTWPLPNVWMGVSTEDQKTADQRIPVLLQTPAVIRFLSCEPLLGPIDLGRMRGMACDGMCDEDVPGTCQRSEHRLRRPDWVIAGGESGGGARPMQLQWARSLRDQCQSAGVAFHFKQTGSITAREMGITGKGHHLDELPEDLRIREYPETKTLEAVNT